MIRYNIQFVIYTNTDTNTFCDRCIQYSIYVVPRKKKYLCAINECISPKLLPFALGSRGNIAVLHYSVRKGRHFRWFRFLRGYRIVPRCILSLIAYSFRRISALGFLFAQNTREAFYRGGDGLIRVVAYSSWV